MPSRRRGLPPWPRVAGVYGGRVDDAEISRFWADARVRGGLNPAGAYLGANVSETLPLADAARAHELIASGGTRGKIVLTID